MRKFCRKCANSYEITADDLQFYDKISPVFGGKKYALPPPEACPECRMQRRLAHRNERKLYSRKCDLCNAEIVSIFHPSLKSKVYCISCYYSDKWDACSYGRNFDFNRPFFDQFRDLLAEVPQLSLYADFTENADYVNMTAYVKNCYLLFASEFDENVYYADNTIKCNDCMDTSQTFNSQLIYDSIDIEQCYNVFYSQNCKNCRDSMFLYECIGCEDCLFSANLRNQKYHIGNKPYSKEGYEKEKAKFMLEISTYAELQKMKNKFRDYIKKQIHRANIMVNTQDSSGNNLVGTKNCRECFNVTGSEDCKYVWDGFNTKDINDINNTTDMELGYYSTSVGHKSYNIIFSHVAWNGSANVIYSTVIKSSKNIFGCSNLQGKSYCILNKQYSKVEYNKLMSCIIEHMIKTGEWGRFFPSSLSHFPYTDTMANIFFPLSKDQAVKAGFNWADYKTQAQDVRTIKAAELPEKTTDIKDDILSHAIECEITGKAFRIIKPELDFYKKNNIPLPHRHPDQRYLERSDLRNPRHLWTRVCAKCSAAINTVYAPDRPETVYCEDCYLKEVY